MAITKSNKTSKPITNKVELSPTTPIPFEGGKAFTHVDTYRYTPFLSGDGHGQIDQFAQMLLEARLLSDTHNACIVTKKDYCAGSGFQYSDNSEFPKEFQEWLDCINVKSDSEVDINKKVFEDFFTWGNVPVELVRFTIAGKKYLYVYHHTLLEWRLGEPDEDTDIITEAIQSRLFLRKDYVLTSDAYKKARKLPIYNPKLIGSSARKNWKKFPDGTERTLIWYLNPVSGFKYYGLPSSVSSLPYQILEFKGARYNIDNFENNMVVSAILALKGSLSQTEANRIGKEAIKSHTGDGKRGRVMVVASEEGIDGSDFHSMNTVKDGSFNESDGVWTQKIILANQWDSVLAGILSNSNLGKGAGFLTKILEIKQNTVIKPAQLDLLKKVWKHIFNIANEWFNWTIDVKKIEIKNGIDISGLTDVDITPAVKVNEVRKAKGLPELSDKKKGDMLLGEMKGAQMKGVYVKDSKGKNKKEEPDDE